MKAMGQDGIKTEQEMQALQASAGLLFAYLRDMLMAPEKATLDVGALDPIHKDLGEGLLFYGKCMDELRDLSLALAKGDLDVPAPRRENRFAAPLKALQASLKHLSWQTGQVAKGDYQQRVDFMGAFSDAFNTMVIQLEERQKALEAEVEKAQRQAVALQQNHALLEAVTDELEQWIVVVDFETRSHLFKNKAMMRLKEKMPALHALIRDGFTDPALMLLEKPEQRALQMPHPETGQTMNLQMDIHPISWYDKRATAFFIRDISEQINREQVLENQAYIDPLTGVASRLYGLRMLEQWVEEQRAFCICFVDLDNLKYVNDHLGHSEGDVYITAAANLLRDFAAGTPVSRLGGDEFMLLAPGWEEADAQERMETLRTRLIQRGEQKGKSYISSISFGVLRVTPGQTLTVSELLELVDNRMYAYKKAHKKAR